MTSSWREVFNRGEALGVWDFGDLNSFWKKCDGCRALRKSFSPWLTQASSVESDWEERHFSLVPNSFVPVGQTCLWTIYSIQFWPVALYSSSPLKECLYTKQAMPHRGFSSWLQLPWVWDYSSKMTNWASLFFPSLLGRISPDLKKTLGNERRPRVHNAEHTASSRVHTVHTQSMPSWVPVLSVPLFEGSGWQGKFCRPRWTRVLLTTKHRGSKLLVAAFCWQLLLNIYWATNGVPYRVEFPCLWGVPLHKETTDTLGCPGQMVQPEQRPSWLK